MTRVYLLPCKPNGSCFYIACRLGIELLEIEKRQNESSSEKPSTSNLNGYSSVVTSSAEDLRKLVVLWQSSGLNKKVPSLGNFDETSKRLFHRSDLLALEAIRQGLDVEESGPKRDEVVQSMIRMMKREGSWASTPEQIAVSHLTNCNVKVWNIDRSSKESSPQGSSPCRQRLILRDTACSSLDPSKNVSCIHLIFDHEHQDVLVTESQKKILEEWFPEQASRASTVFETENL